ncbi:MAG: trypsin-like peptidase domain-containing protein [Acidobacteriia bacterium]|nr:trypsin-like peptidase domain-containing protein [Terriglobia bacterium]
MNRSLKSPNPVLTGKRLVVLATLALALCLGGYAALKPAAASASSVAHPLATSAAAPLDDNSVSAITALDHAMETLAAHVTPAVVNVTVTSRNRGGQNIFNGPGQGQGQGRGQGQGQGDDDDDGTGAIQRFFGPFGFGQRVRPSPQIEHGLGSGVVISPDGYIVTNHHVIDGAVDIRVTTTDRRVLPAKLIGYDKLTDLAVIKVDAANLASLPWGDSTTLKPGQTVLAFGNPFGFRFTVTRGIVSALNRANPYSDDPRKPGEFIQTDAAINPGNSGGPLVNARGEIVGINTFLISASGTFSGMGFAIPTQIAHSTVDTLIKYGKVEHARIGVVINDVTPENAGFFKLTTASGALVSQVEPDAPGAKAGLKVGDVITQVDGKKVETSGQLQAFISQQRPGAKVTLEISRDGHGMTVPVTLAALDSRAANNDAGGKSSEARGTDKARWGVGFSDLTQDLREQLQLPKTVEGAVVTQVQPGSPADNAGISRGDVILEVNRKPVKDSADAQRELRSVASGKDALVLVWSNGGSSFRVLHAAEAGQGDGE